MRTKTSKDAQVQAAHASIWQETAESLLLTIECTCDDRLSILQEELDSITFADEEHDVREQIAHFEAMRQQSRQLVEKAKGITRTGR